MWITFKYTLFALLLWQFIAWRVTLYRNKRRRRNKVKVKQVVPDKPKPDTVMIGANDNKRNDLTKYVPTTVPDTPHVANDATPGTQPLARRNDKMINQVISAMVNLGMAKRKAKQHVNDCYDNMTGKITLEDLLTYSIKSLHA